MSKCVFDYLEFGYCAGDFDQLVFHAKNIQKNRQLKYSIGNMPTKG